LLTGVVVAAGSSRRLGSPKQLLPFRGATLLDATLDTARACGFDQLLVTLGGDAADRPRRGRPVGTEVVEPVHYRPGAPRRSSPPSTPSTHVRGDRAAARRSAGVTTGRRHRAGRRRVPTARSAVCRYEDGPGHPLWFGRDVFADLARAPRGQGRLEAARERPLPGHRGTRRRVPSPSTSTRGRTTSASRQRGARRDGDRTPVFADREASVRPSTPRATSPTGAGHGHLPRAGARPAAAARGRTRRRQDHRREGPRPAVGSELLRLQCYEGITASEALYEWNYPRQLLAIRTRRVAWEAVEDDDLFTERYLVDRPLLGRSGGTGPHRPCADRRDRPADDEFEALLYEFLGESSVTVPELGTFRAARPPS
jgi:CTP:molybdopterin cytidylyltransferase MocA